MSFDLPDESSGLYRYVRRLDRRVSKVRHKAASHLSGLGFKWLGLIFFFVIPMVVIVTLLIQRTHTRYILLTGPSGSTTAHLAPRLQHILNEPAQIERLLHLNLVPDFEPRPSCGALESIALIRAGVAHLGFAEDGVPAALAGSRFCSLSSENILLPSQVAGMDAKMRVVMLLYKSPLHIVARTKLGFKDIQDLTPGTKVYLGPTGSATHFVGQEILKHYGLIIEGQGENFDFDQGAKGLLDGRFDVGFFLMGLQTDVLRTLLQPNHDFQLLSIGQASSLKMLFPYLEPLTIPAAIYPSVLTEVQSVGTNTVLVASTALGESEIFEVTTKVAEHAQDLLRGVPLNFAREIDNDPKRDVFYQIHDGAHRFFTHDPPFFLDVRTLAGVGTYFSVVSACAVMMLQFLRHYRVHRLLITVDLILERSHGAEKFPNSTRPIPHLQKIRNVALRLMRRRKITYEEFSRFEDYIKAHYL